MYKKLMQDMDKTTLLRMRDEEGMSYAEIAEAVGCSKGTIHRILGPLPMEVRRERQAAAGRKYGGGKATRTREGGYTVERKMQSFMRHEEPQEPARAVLVMKPVKMPIPLRGEFMHYCISADRDVIDVETEQGRALIQIPADKLDTFIEELTAISRNIGSEKPMQFWG